MFKPAAERRAAAFSSTHSHPGLTDDGVDLTEAIQQFRDLGGTLIGAGEMKFEIGAKDHLFPVCMSGLGASQVLHVLLRRVTQRFNQRAHSRDANGNKQVAGFEGTVYPLSLIHI
eukprot:TRINITY_DN46764_c0_g1_i1.p2 TRINITY_DN46764_c0_g1~~TRINITY_DN46764_c0_g1_i1.p2  ORF type:complete len:115 (-),score=29.38 TRINITY_DN46764_c0_g1_i1:121-465(-)